MRFNRACPSVKKIYRFLLPPLLVLLMVTLQCCGSRVTRSESNRLRVALRVPEGEGRELFWTGVQARRLRWLPKKGEEKQADWAEGGVLDWEAREGDRVAFEAIDGAGRVVVLGEAPVTEEKNVTIPLRRVL